MSSEHARRLHLLLKRLVHSDSVESLISHDRLVSFVTQSRLHIDDFSIVTGDVSDHLAKLHRQLDYRATQVMFFMTNAPEALVKQAKTAADAVIGGDVDLDRLAQLEDIAEKRFGPHWEAPLAKHLETTVAQVKRWRNIREGVPASAIEAVVDMTEGELRDALEHPPEVTAVVGPRAWAGIGTLVVEKRCRPLVTRILELGELTEDAAKALMSSRDCVRDLIRDGWIFSVPSRGTLVSFKRRHEFMAEWNDAAAIRRDFPPQQMNVLEALDRHQTTRGISLPDWDSISVNAIGRGQRGGVNSFVSDFQRRRRGEGIIYFTGKYPHTLWLLRPDWRDG